MNVHSVTGEKNGSKGKEKKYDKKSGSHSICKKVISWFLYVCNCEKVKGQRWDNLPLF